MGSAQSSIETTIVDVWSGVGEIRVECSPRIFELPLILEKSHPNFIELYNKLCIASTHKIILQSTPFGATCIIDDIQPLLIHYMCDIVKGFLDISIEYKDFSQYKQVVFINDTSNNRLLINKSEPLAVGSCYSIYYRKAFGNDLYEITKYEEATNF